jgi:hypothetical protein
MSQTTLGAMVNACQRPRRALSGTVAFAVVATVLVTLTSTPSATAQPAVERFIDVPTNHPFYDEIEWMATSGLTTGSPQPDGTTLFRPADPVSREAFAAFLYRHAGQPQPTFQRGPYFADVDQSHAFYDAIQWMGATGLSTGSWVDGAPVFKPADPVTREVAAAFLYRFEGSPPRPTYPEYFDDNPQGHPFHEAISWMKTAGISHGYYEMPTVGDSTNYLNFFRGHQLVERQAIAAFFQRLVLWEPYTGCGSTTTMSLSECEALVDIWIAAERSIGNSWAITADRWNQGSDPCAWVGVTCRDGHVTALSLGPRAGTIAGEIGELTHLEHLSVQNFGPGATIPAEMGRLSRLRSFEVLSGNIAGALPPEIAGLTSLSKLTLRGTSLDEPLPATLGQLGGLRELEIVANFELPGPLPTSLGDLGSLRSMTIQHNTVLSGPLPALTGLHDLRDLLLHDNWLSGSIPDTFGGLDRLVGANLARNDFSGPIPASFGDARALEALDLSANSFSGPIPEELGHTRLSNLDLSANELSGPIPASLLPFPGQLKLRGNGCLTAPDPSWEPWLSSRDERWNEGCSPTTGR